MLIENATAHRLYVENPVVNAAMASTWTVFVTRQPEEKENSMVSYSMLIAYQTALMSSVPANLLFFYRY